MPNRLAQQTSPYLLQHQDNPVDWYPWGQEALERSRAEQRPIFLSIGYSACHWCHVMEHESFENDEIAYALNKEFVCIKVDREERPDLDQIYMAAVQMLTGRGGWPMSVFLTPELLPFYGGTYWPPRSKHGMPGFDQVIAAVAAAWRDRRDHAITTAGEIADQMRKMAAPELEPGELTLDLITGAAGRMERSDGTGMTADEAYATWAAANYKLFAHLTAVTPSVVAVKDNPQLDVDPLECLTRPWSGLGDCSMSRAEAEASNGDLPDISADTWTKYGVTTWDGVWSQTCDERSCSVGDISHPVYRDYHHLSAGYVLTQVPSVEQMLRAAVRGTSASNTASNIG